MEMVESVDVDCAMNMLAKQAVDIAQKTGMDNARNRVHQNTIEILKFAKTGGIFLSSLASSTLLTSPHTARSSGRLWRRRAVRRAIPVPAGRSG